MAVADKNSYWTSRMSGENPASLSGANNTSFSGSGGSDSNGSWTITNSTYSIGGSGAMSMVAMLSFTTAPTSGDVIMRLDNGSKRVEVRSKGNLTQLDLVGTTTVTINDLDLNMAEDNAVPLILRLTLDDSGNAKLYTHEILNDTDGNAAFYSVAGSSGSGATSIFGNTSGSIKWYSVYYTAHGAFNPEELMLSSFAQDTLARMGLVIIDSLKDCKRPMINQFVQDSSIIYGYDLSSEMLNRVQVPSIHVVISDASSPNFNSLGGSSIEQLYEISIYVTTKGTNYEEAFRLGLNIIGEVFDELYTTTGIRATTDNLEAYNLLLDVKMDDDETVCVHQLNITYRKRIKMNRR
tara:strand:+ start:839 stop:1891 length:1053 start_codon:yes stop_codon:yes gene_type:complete